MAERRFMTRKMLRMRPGRIGLCAALIGVAAAGFHLIAHRADHLAKRPILMAEHSYSQEERGERRHGEAKEVRRAAKIGAAAT